MPATPPPPDTHTDHQDLVNQLLAGAMDAAAVLRKTHQAVALLVTRAPQAAAHLADAAVAWARTRDAMVRAADELVTRENL